MKYFSLNGNANEVSFEEAVVKGLAPDRGLYFPKEIPVLDKSFVNNLAAFPNQEIAFKTIQPFVGNDIESESLRKIINETLCFEFPLISIEENIHSLELFHGPTLAFKDVGARFMARCLAYFNKQSNRKITVLVATSGDTGGAVANGFLGVDGVEVVILYPKGRVSAIQEGQLTTLGNNITALEVNGSFDDCQTMVKSAFLDSQITQKITLTSANSINVARWLPQMFYYFFAFKTLENPLHKKVAFAVPSGNFGNICAGLMSQQMGLPIHHFIAGTNANDTVPKFLESGTYKPKQSQATISNAMDVGDPSNFIRIQQLFNGSLNKIKTGLSSFSYTDLETKEAMQRVYKDSNYVLDPHGAIGYLALSDFLKKHPDYCGVFLETAHPAKFLETVENTLQTKISIPLPLQEVLKKEKKSRRIENYDALKEYLLTE